MKKLSFAVRAITIEALAVVVLLALVSHNTPTRQAERAASFPRFFPASEARGEFTFWRPSQQPRAEPLFARFMQNVVPGPAADDFSAPPPWLERGRGQD